MAHWLGIQVRENCQLSSLARGVTGSALQMARASGWDLCSGPAASRNALCQDLSTGFCKPHPPIHLYQSPEDSSSDLHEASLEWASWEVSHMLGKLDVHLRLSFPTVETTGVGCRLGVALCQFG